MAHQIIEKTALDAQRSRRAPSGADRHPDPRHHARGSARHQDRRVLLGPPRGRNARHHPLPRRSARASRTARSNGLRSPRAASRARWSSSSTTSCSPGAPPAPPSTRCATSAAPVRCNSRCSSTAATANCRSAPTTSARTCPPRAARTSGCCSRSRTARTVCCWPREMWSEASAFGHRPGPGGGDRAARRGATFRAGPARPRGAQAADAARAHRDDGVLRELDPHPGVVRGRRQVDECGRDQRQRVEFVGAEGRVAAGHGDDAARRRRRRADRAPPRLRVRRGRSRTGSTAKARVRR